MGRYSGEHVHTITINDIGKTIIERGECSCCGRRLPPLSLQSVMGRVLPGDVGKWLVQYHDVLMVESDSQRDKRQAEKNTDATV